MRRCWPRADADRSTDTRPIPRSRQATASRSRIAPACKLADMEFVQFHPTALETPENPLQLISEAVRGEGAVLLNEEGERFMLKKHRLAELAPRDVVAREIFREQAGGKARLSRCAKAGAIVQKTDFRESSRSVAGARHRSVEGSDSGDAGRALHDGRNRHRSSRPVEPAAAVCMRRGVAHRRSRREPAGVELAARRTGVRGAGGARHDRRCQKLTGAAAQERAGTFRCCDDRGAAQVAADACAQVMWDHCGHRSNARRVCGMASSSSTEIETRLPVGATEEANMVRDVAADRRGGADAKGIARRALSKRFSARGKRNGAASTSNGEMTHQRPKTTYAELQEEIKRSRRERNAVILAHNYERPEVQDVADFVGDSLGLSREARKDERRRHRLLRRAFHGGDGGGSFAAEDGAAAGSRRGLLARRDDRRRSSCATWKAEHPGAVVVSYVNTTAEVKAESDYCCTSGNAVEIVNSIPADKEILFLPDMFLGAHVRRVTGRQNMHVWMGECHVHAGIDPEHINLQRAAHPGAEFLIHPGVRMRDERRGSGLGGRRRSGRSSDSLDRRNDQSSEDLRR